MTNKIVRTLVLVIVMVAGLTSQALADAPLYEIELQARSWTPKRITHSTRSADTFNGRYGLIQLDALPTEAQEEALVAAGVTRHQYIPNLTWTATFDSVAAVRQLDFVRWIGGLQPADKLAPALASVDTASVVVNVALWAGAAADLSDYGTLIEAHDAFLTLAIKTDNLTHLASENSVMWIEPAQTASLLTAQSTAAHSGNLGLALPNGLTGEDVVIGIFDIGAVDAHPSFDDRLIVDESAGGLVKHATMVAGVSASVATDSQINSYGYGDTQPLTEEEVDVAVHAWGLTGCETTGQYDLYAQQYDGFALAMIFSVGNSQRVCDNRPTGYKTVLGGPQSGKNTITIGSTDENGDIASFSSQGPTLDGRLAPMFVIDGVNIRSTCLDGAFCIGSGTSYSAPRFGGMVALITEAYHDYFGVTTAMKSAEVRALFAATAQDRGTTGPDYTYGFGIADAVAAQAALPSLQNDSVAQANANTTTITIPSGQMSLTLALAWDDLPATILANPTLINDLDVTLTAPNGTRHYPYTLDSSNPAQAATRGVDGINTTEQIVVVSPQAGDWTVTVTGSQIPTGTQDYSLAYALTAQPTLEPLNATTTTVFLPVLVNNN